MNGKFGKQKSFSSAFGHFDEERNEDFYDDGGFEEETGYAGKTDGENNGFFSLQESL